MNSPHLIHDELLLAVVDAADLDFEKRSHLDGCSICRNACGHLEARFLRLGNRARELAPAPERPFRLPSAQTPAIHWGLKPLWGVALAAALLLAVVIGRSGRPSLEPVPVPTAAALEADRRLSEAVDALVEDALPITFQRLAATDEEGALGAPEMDEDLDEDMLDWVVPPVQADNQFVG